MIENPYPHTWQDLQEGVACIFREIGLNAETEKIIETPRGKVELDVFAVDEGSIDKIRYVVECKNWKAAIPQAVVHSFTTVMHEVGANIGFIVSQEGLQAGAEAYTRNTNILGLTYEEFQARYFPVWFDRHFVKSIGDVVSSLVEYTEPVNTRRESIVWSRLTDTGRQQYDELIKRYWRFGYLMAFFEFPRYVKDGEYPPPQDITSLKSTIEQTMDGALILESVYYRDLLQELVNYANKATEEFNDVFGENIFA